MRIRALGATVIALAFATGAPATAVALDVDVPRPVVRPVPGPGAHWQTAVDPAGDVIFARALSGEIGLGVGTPGAAVEPAVAPGQDDTFKLVAAPNGEALAVWFERDGGAGAVRYASRAAGASSFGPVQTLEIPSLVLTEIDAAIAPNGAAAVLVGEADATTPTRLEVYRRPSAAASFGPAEPLDGVIGAAESRSRVVVRSDGAAAVISRPEPYEEETVQPVYVSVAGPGEPFARARALSARGTHVEAFRVLAFGDGRVAVAWAGLRDIGDYRLGATSGDLTRLAAGHEIARDGAANLVDLAAGGPGAETATLAWRTRRGVRVAEIGGGRIGPSTRHGRTPSAGGRGPRPGARFPAVAIDAAGRRTLIWQEGYRGTRRLYGLTASSRRPQNLGYIDVDSEIRLVASGDATYLTVAQNGSIQLRESTAGARFGRLVTVTSLGDTGAIFDSRVLPIGDGGAVVIWGSSDFVTRNQALTAARVTP